MTIDIKATFLQAIYKPAGTYNGISYKEKYILVFLDDKFNTVEFAVPTLPTWHKESTYDNLLVGTLIYELARNPRGDRPGFEAFVSKYVDFTDIVPSRIVSAAKGKTSTDAS